MVMGGGTRGASCRGEDWAAEGAASRVEWCRGGEGTPTSGRSRGGGAGLAGRTAFLRVRLLAGCRGGGGGRPPLICGLECGERERARRQNKTRSTTRPRPCSSTTRASLSSSSLGLEMDWGNLPFSLQLLVFDSTQQVLSSPADPPSSFPFLILSYTPATWVLLCSFYLVGTTAYCVGQSKRIRLPADGDTECSGALQRIRHFAAIFEVFVREQDILEVELESEDGEEVLSTVDLEALLPPQPITLRLLPLAEALGWITWSVWLAFLAASTRSQSSCSVLLLSGVSSLSWVGRLCSSRSQELTSADVAGARLPQRAAATEPTPTLRPTCLPHPPISFQRCIPRPIPPQVLLGISPFPSRPPPRRKKSTRPRLLYLPHICRARNAFACTVRISNPRQGPISRRAS